MTIISSITPPFSAASSTAPDESTCNLADHLFLSGGDESVFLLGYTMRVKNKEGNKQINILNAALAFPGLYNALQGDYFFANILEKLAIDEKTSQAEIERIFGLNTDSSAREKVKQIWLTIRSFKGEQPEPFSFPSIRAKYQRYQRFYPETVLAFWKKLPGGKEYLESEAVQTLSNYKKALKLKEWMQTISPEVLDLTSLDLGYCNLNFLPVEIGLLTKLKELYLYHNQFSALPDGIAHLTNLKQLDLEHNQLSALPDSISNLTKLKDLSLSGNHLSALPEKIKDLENLTIDGMNLQNQTNHK